MARQLKYTDLLSASCMISDLWVEIYSDKKPRKTKEEVDKIIRKAYRILKKTRK